MTSNLINSLTHSFGRAPGALVRPGAIREATVETINADAGATERGCFKTLSSRLFGRRESGDHDRRLGIPPNATISRTVLAAARAS